MQGNRLNEQERREEEREREKKRKEEKNEARGKKVNQKRRTINMFIQRYLCGCPETSVSVERLVKERERGKKSVSFSESRFLSFDLIDEKSPKFNNENFSFFIEYHDNFIQDELCRRASS